MKRAISFFIFFKVCFLFAYPQVITNKAVKILYGADENKCLQKSSSQQLTISQYKEKANQEWFITPSLDSKFYLLRTADSSYLCSYKGKLKGVSFCQFKSTVDDSDEYKFHFTPKKNGGWSISPKNQSEYFLQPKMSSDSIIVAPKTEFSTTTFLIDTIPYRRPIPPLKRFEKAMCAVGVTKDLKSLEVFGVEATFFQPGGMYPTQFVVRIYLSSDKQDKLEIVIYDDIFKIRKKKSYYVIPKGSQTQPYIRLFSDDQVYSVLNNAEIVLQISNLRNNSFNLLIQKANVVNELEENKAKPFYDIALKGVYLLQ